MDDIGPAVQRDKTIFTTLDGLQVVSAFVLLPIGLIASAVFIVGLFWSVSLMIYARFALAAADFAVFLALLNYLEVGAGMRFARFGARLVTVFSLASVVVLFLAVASMPTSLARVSLADLLAAVNAFFAVAGLYLWSVVARVDTPTKTLVRAWLASKKEPTPDLIVHLAYYGSVMQRLILYSYIRRLQRRG